MTDDLIPLTWGIEIPEDLIAEAEALFAKLTERRCCRCFVDEEGKHVMKQPDGKMAVCLTASVTPKDYVGGLPPRLIRKLFDHIAAQQALRDTESRIYQPFVRN